MIEFSPLTKTWILDVDGTIVKHNGYLIDGYDTLLGGVKEFFKTIPDEDKIILLTDMPMGERILVNDRKPSGLDMAFAFNKSRDEKLEIEYKINKEL